MLAACKRRYIVGYCNVIDCNSFAITVVFLTETVYIVLFTSIISFVFLVYFTILLEFIITFLFILIKYDGNICSNSFKDFVQTKFSEFSEIKQLK
jgi:hypothetical protein